jgi:hypothetical protein
MWNIFEQPWAGLAAAVILLNIMAVVRWFVPLERKWLFLPPVAVALLALGLCYLVDTDRELVERVMSKAIDGVRQQKPDVIAGLVAPDYSDSRHHSRDALIGAWKQWMGRFAFDHVGTSDVVYDISRGSATVTFSWLVRFARQPGHPTDMDGMIVFGRAKVTLVETPHRKWLVRSSELLELMNHPTNWQRVDF